MNPVFLASISVALLWLLFLMLRRSTSEVKRARLSPAGSEYEVRLPPRYLLDQCLSMEDLEFVRRRKSSALLGLFLEERRRLAALWLRETRREAHRLLRLHLNSVRFAADLRPAAESRLFLAVAVFFLIYGALMTAVWFYGPLQTRRFLDSTHALARLLARVTDRIAVTIAPGAVPRMGAVTGLTN
ncbi:MAG TPA: hypothetical protein VH640_05760 [Bryobacteraceae bacterium]|jgi:hypothetical protein